MIVGLTGVILSGKSAALEIFKSCGADILSADEIVAGILGPADKKKIAREIFSDEKKRKEFEAALWPRVLEEAKKKIKKSKKDIIVFEVPLLFEAKWENNFDVIIAISVNKKNQAARAKKRNQPDYLKRAAAQLSDDEKAAKADIVIHNNASPQNLEMQVKEVYKNLGEICQRNKKKPAK